MNIQNIININTIITNWKIMDIKSNIKARIFILIRIGIYSQLKSPQKGIYQCKILANSKWPQIYLIKNIELSDFNWKKIYLLPRNTTLETKARMFQYKILHNTLYVNKMLFKFGKVISPRCSFCKLHDETIMHLFMTA